MCTLWRTWLTRTALVYGMIHDGLAVLEGVVGGVIVCPTERGLEHFRLCFLSGSGGASEGTFIHIHKPVQFGDAGVVQELEQKLPLSLFSQVGH